MSYNFDRFLKVGAQPEKPEVPAPTGSFSWRNSFLGLESQPLDSLNLLSIPFRKEPEQVLPSFRKEDGGQFASFKLESPERPVLPVTSLPKSAQTAENEPKIVRKVGASQLSKNNSKITSCPEPGAGSL